MDGLYAGARRRRILPPLSLGSGVVAHLFRRSCGYDTRREALRLVVVEARAGASLAS
jgi:hypothetical protein